MQEVDADRNVAHLTTEEVAGYVDHALSAEALARVQDHLADCDACREEAVAVKRLAQPRAASVRRTWYVAAGVAAAAVALLIVRPTPSPELDVPRLRDAAPAEGVPVFGAVTPRDGATVDPDAITFVWRAAAPDASYRLTLTTGAGDLVWEKHTPDTAVALPPAVELDRSRTFYWYVDALKLDGRTATTGVRSFTVVVP